MASTDQDAAARLPIRGNLAPAYVASLVVAALMAAASIAGLLYPTSVYPTDDLAQGFIANDVVNLLVGLPILLGSMVLARRGKLIGLLFWPGALLAGVYNDVVYVLALPVNLMYLLHLTLLALSVYTTIGLLASIDAQAVKARLVGGVPERFCGGVLAGLGVLFVLLAVGTLSNAIFNQAVAPETELATYTSDFLIVFSWIIGGVLLWRRQPFGYVAGVGLLFQGSMLFIGLIVFLLLQPVLTAAPFNLGDVVAVSVLGLICFVPCGLFVRGVVAHRS